MFYLVLLSWRDISDVLVTLRFSNLEWFSYVLAVVSWLLCWLDSELVGLLYCCGVGLFDLGFGGFLVVGGFCVVFWTLSFAGFLSFGGLPGFGWVFWFEQGSWF